MVGIRGDHIGGIGGCLLLDVLAPSPPHGFTGIFGNATSYKNTGEVYASSGACANRGHRRSARVLMGDDSW